MGACQIPLTTGEALRCAEKTQGPTWPNCRAPTGRHHSAHRRVRTPCAGVGGPWLPSTCLLHRVTVCAYGAFATMCRCAHHPGLGGGVRHRVPKLGSSALKLSPHPAGFLHTYKHKYIHTYIHTHEHTYTHPRIHCAHIHTYIITYIHTYIHTCMHACRHSCIILHTHMHTCIHTYIHKYKHANNTIQYNTIHTYMHTCIHTTHTYNALHCIT